MTARVDGLMYARPACSNYTPCGNGDTDCARCGEIGSAHSMTARVDDCCGDPSQCWEPCGILGKSAEHARRSAVVFATKRDADTFVERRIKPREMRLDYVPPRTTIQPRKVGWLERLIAGPQGDPDLRSDFYSFLGCLACGIGLAAVILAVVMAAREFLP
jgi:hypothetical protein